MPNRRATIALFVVAIAIAVLGCCCPGIPSVMTMDRDSLQQQLAPNTTPVTAPR